MGEILEDFAVKLMGVGRPKIVEPERLSALAVELYRDFQRLRDGTSRQWLDRTYYAQLVEQLDKIEFQLTDAQKEFMIRIVDERIRSGRLAEAEKANVLRHLQICQAQTMYMAWRELALDEATKKLPVRGEPEVLDQLLRAETAEQVREICKDGISTTEISVVDPTTGEVTGHQEVEISNWPGENSTLAPYVSRKAEQVIGGGNPLPQYLFKFAEQFIAAKNDPKYPRSPDRKTSKAKQLWFLSRAVAGAFFGISHRTAIDLVPSSDIPERRSRAAKVARKKSKRRYPS